MLFTAAMLLHTIQAVGTGSDSTSYHSPESDPHSVPPGQERTLVESVLVQLSILLRYKWLIIGLTTLAAVGVLAFSIVSLVLPPAESPLPNYYEASATLLISEDAGGSSARSMLSALGVTVSGGGTMDYGQVAQQVVRTRTFLDQLVEEHNIIDRYEIEEEVRTRSREVILNSTTVNYQPQTRMITVSYRHIDPEFACRMTNSTVNHLQEWFLARGGLTRQRELQSLESRILEVEEEIARLEAEIQTFQREHGFLDVAEIAERQSTMISGLQAQLVELEVRIRNQQRFSRIEDDPALARLRAERNNVVGLINDIENGYAAGGRAMPSRNELPELAREFRRLQTDLEIQLRIYQAISEQYEVARLTAESEPVFAVLEPAEVPDQKSGPSRAELSMTVTGMAFVGSIVLAYIIHFLRGIWADPTKKTLISESLRGGGSRKSEAE
jgi:uncharacterized protein involved in exopolysaccharide biosynthesis